MPVPVERHHNRRVDEHVLDELRVRPAWMAKAAAECEGHGRGGVFQRCPLASPRAPDTRPEQRAAHRAASGAVEEAGGRSRKQAQMLARGLSHESRKGYWARPRLGLRLAQVELPTNLREGALIAHLGPQEVG